MPPEQSAVSPMRNAPQVLLLGHLLVHWLVSGLREAQSVQRAVISAALFHAGPLI